MFLSVVILGGFTTETHAMAHLITTDTPDDYLHHFRDATATSPQPAQRNRWLVAARSISPTVKMTAVKLDRADLCSTVMRDRETIDSELRLLAAVRRVAAEYDRRLSPAAATLTPIRH
jgi:hypothetical protein